MVQGNMQGRQEGIVRSPGISATVVLKHKVHISISLCGF